MSYLWHRFGPFMVLILASPIIPIGMLYLGIQIWRGK